MKRTLYQNLLKWKFKEIRKPLLVQGARQVGKTYLLEEFGNREYNDLAYFNFEKTKDLHSLFETSLDPINLVELLSAYQGRKITPESTLIFFDEIQACPRALTSLKYFCEDAPKQHIVAAGSLLGVSVGKTSSFPVGKIDFMTLYPMTFFEYLEAANEKLLIKQLEKNKNFQPIPEPLHNKLINLFKFYLFLGGMPEVVSHYIKQRDILEARHIQKDILNAYSRDFSKYTTPNEAIRISEIWHSISTQLAKENKKFKYRDVTKGGRASRFESSIEWLKKTGLIHMSYNIKTPKLPLSGYADHGKFKVYLLDSGLLGAMLNVPSETIVDNNKLFSEYNGAFVENYVVNELIAQEFNELYYWTSKSDAEVDFILPIENSIVPLEVKSGMSRRTKSLRVYSEKYNPHTVYRTSPRNFTKDGDLINIPLYAISQLQNRGE
jgi:predicted AAA+ superfamily ATPase